MNKERFLEVLAAKLQVLDNKEKQDILDEYALHIDMKVAEGLSEEEAIKDFGDVKELVADILEAYHVNPEYCTPSNVRKKEWKTPDMNKVKEEGIEACTKAGGFLKRKMKAYKENCGRAFKRGKMFFKSFGCKKEKEEIQMRKENERHIIREIWHGCKSAVIWCVRFCWNTMWFLVAATFAMCTIIALFSFGVLVILNAQGYPLAGVTVGSFGAILMSGALTGLSLSFRKKSRKNKLQLTLAGVLGAGILLTGVGTGIALKEYSSLEYTGEHIVEAKNMQTQKGEVTFLETEDGEPYHIYCGADEYEVVEDASVPELVVKYEATYNADKVIIDVHGTAEEGYFSIVSAWGAGFSFEDWMICKDEILKELKQNKIGSYRTMEIEKVTFTVNPKMAEMMHIE